MASIYLHQIESLIDKLEEAGVDVITEDYVIMAHTSVIFDADVYPLEIIVSNRVPARAVYVVKRPSV